MKIKIQQNLPNGLRMIKRSHNKVVTSVFHQGTKRDTEELLRKYLESIFAGVVNLMALKEV